MSEYSAVRVGKLRLKGCAGESLKSKKKRKRKREITQEEMKKEDLRHGGWRRVYTEETLGGRILMLTCTGGYIQALDNGSFCVGQPRTEGDGPEAGEVFNLVRAGETKVAMKSAYGRYVGVSTSGELTGRMEAMGPREQWDLVFEEGKVALCGCNHRFLTVTDDGKLVTASEKAEEREVMSIWSDAPEIKKIRTAAEEETELAERDMTSVEVSYVKKFQSWKDKRVRVCEENRDNLDTARQSGKLHEALLDRREKMKADRYCK